MTRPIDLGIPGLDDATMLGRGIGSVVYRCLEPALNRHVAAKVFDAAPSSEEAKSFSNECRTLGQFHWCPEIVTVFAAGVSQHGHPYLTMEYLDDGSLRDRLRRTGPLSDADLAGLGVDLAKALRAAHDAAVLHRDVKPANVLMTRSGRFVLSDFGVARGLTEWTNETAGMAGTVAFAAPEVLDGDEASRASDLFSVGATLFAARAGHGPHALIGDTSVRTQMARALQRVPVDVEQLGLPPALTAVLLRCLAPDPGERYQDADALLRACASLHDLARVPPRPPPSPATYRSPTGPPPGPPPDVPRWPGRADYVKAAVEAPELAWEAVGELGGMAFAVDSAGRPDVVSGDQAVVFRIESTAGTLALRCFTRGHDDDGHRYRQLRDFLDATPLACVPSVRWLERSLEVGGRRWPAVLMPWVDGLTLEAWVASRLRQPLALADLAREWLALAVELHAIGLAHGDLHPANIVVDDAGGIRLVDLDGCYVPGMTRFPAEIGHPDFQHPRRAPEHWGPDIDAFSVLVIYLGLRALSVDPDLWRFHNGDNMMLSAEDFAGDGEVWQALHASSDAEVRRVTGLLRDCLRVGYPPQAEFILNQLQKSGTAASVPTGESPDPPSEPGQSRATESTGATTSELTTLKAIRRPAPGAPSATSTVVPDSDDWWEGLELEPLDEDQSEPVARSSRSRFGFLRNAILSGIGAGLISALVGCGLYVLLARELFAPPLRGPFFVALVGALMTSTLASSESLLRGAWRRWAATAALGLGAGAVTTLAGLGAFQLAISGSTDTLTGPDAPLWFAAGIWIVTGVSVGVAIGLTRRRLRVASYGALGGVVAGAIGGLVYYSSNPRLTLTGTNRWLLYLDFRQATTTLSVVGACALLGLGIGVAEQLSRRSWLRVIEGQSSGLEIPLDRHGATIGTGSADLRLSGTDGSLTKHARVRASGDGFVVWAVGEVELNGSTVPTSTPLPLLPQDVLRIGGSFIRFESLQR